MLPEGEEKVREGYILERPVEKVLSSFNVCLAEKIARFNGFLIR